MDSLFCLNTGFTSNDRNNVKKTFIVNAHTLYFYLQKADACDCYRTEIASAAIDGAVIAGFKFLKSVFSKILLLKPLLFKKGAIISTQTSRLNRYFLPLPFW